MPDDFGAGLGPSGAQYYRPSPVYGPVVYVHDTSDVDDNGAALQAACDQAAIDDNGTTIVLDPGVEYRMHFWNGELTLPYHANPLMINIVTDGIQTDDPTYPAFGECIDPSDSANLAVITQFDSLPGAIGRTTILIPYNVHYWAFRGVRIAPEISHQYPIVKVGGGYGGDLDNGGPSSANQASHIVFDRVLINPSSTYVAPDVIGHHFTNNTASLQLNGTLCHVIGCYFEIYDNIGQGDYKNLESGYGNRIYVEECTFKGGGETVFIGGGGQGDPFSLGYTPTTYWEFHRCLMVKDREAMAAAGWLSKNILETKGSTNIKFVGCLLDANQTTVGDTGQERMVPVVAYPGGEDPIYFNVKNWTFEDCLFRRARAFTLQRKWYTELGNTYASQTPSSGMYFDNCLFYKFRTVPTFFFYLYGFSDFSMTHCTFDLYDATSAQEPYVGFFMYEDQEVAGTPATPLTGFVLKDCVIAGNYLRLLSNNAEIGSYKYNNNFYTTYLSANSPVLTNNVWLAVDGHNGDPVNLFDTHFTSSDGGPNWDGRNDSDYRTTIFTDADAEDYRIKAGTPYKAGGARDASDGKDVGVDYTRMQQKMGSRVWAYADLGF